MRSARGFTSIELLIATSIALVVLVAVLGVARTAPDAFAVEAEAADMNQRIRVATETLLRDLLAAEGVRPYRSHGGSPDPPGTFKPDTITLISRSIRTYWLKADDRTETYQLMMYAGGTSLDVPVVDNVVGLSFQYFGDPRPPTMVRLLSDPSGPWTTYGPVPARGPVGPYPAGENCVFLANGTELPDPRLPVLPPAGSNLVPLAANQFADGPWCPDEAAIDRWDADLLRVRAVAATLRVQAASPSLRGPAGPLFMRSGTSTSGSRWVPDLEIHVQTAPRNLDLGR
jgi:type II secretory pathway pseudopilin PulG